MNSHKGDMDVAMLESSETLPEQNNHHQEVIYKPLDAGATHVFRGKEMRVEQQYNDAEEEEEVAIEAVVADDEDDDGDAVMATVVVNEGEDNVPIAELTSTPIKSNTTPPSAASRSNKSKAKRKSQRIPQDRLSAAAEARAMLADTVTRLPVMVSDTHVVRSFGRIYVESSKARESKYSSASALYPVGFSCDRYEFSPVHGRVLKMRCTIFDGKKVKEKQNKLGIQSSDLPDGPVFRVMWGQGVDEDVDVVDYPYDVYTDSPSLVDDSKVDTVAVPLSGKDLSELEPEEGMRVRVRFEHNVWFSGTIVSVSDEEYDQKMKQATYEISINYDDGSTENTVFPDPDISIYLPGAEDSYMENGTIEIDELRGKPVTCVIGTSPIHAWGKALIKLGLIDEIMMQSALDARAVAQEEGRAEAKEKMEEKKAKRLLAQTKSTQQRQATATENGDDSTNDRKEISLNGEKPTEDEASKEGQMNGAGPKETDLPEHTPVDKNEKTTSEAGPSLPTSVTNVKESETSKVPDDPSLVEHTEGGSTADVIQEEVAEPPSATENELRSQVQQLQQDLTSLQTEDRESSIALADTRISTMGPFFCNPFHESGPTLTQQAQWLTNVVRKEKTKMGSTGNKKKVVSATDLLERIDTFFNNDIEALVEGLPGSEYCPSYVFRSFRAGGASAVSQAWVHEAKLRQEREREKQFKSPGEKMGAFGLGEKEVKRKRREDERNARKRQKKGVMDEKKRARAEERMARLNVQVEDRLYNEACAQREKLIQLFARTLVKDFGLRRKAAELVSAQAINANCQKRDSVPQDILPQEIPSLGRVYDEDVLRVWDFFATFGPIFLERGYLPSIPSLDSLQDSIDSLRGGVAARKSRAVAIEQLLQIATALCHPLAATVTRYLFSSLIALNPALQKDFGAAFFNEVNASSNANDDPGASSANGVLPLNMMTWSEIARLAFLSDSLGEIGYSRQDSAHLIRGYRSGGHPNSKESKRLRRSEDYKIGLLRQELGQRESNETAVSEEVSDDFKVRVNVPSRPSSSPNHWTFYLHTLKSLPAESLNLMKENIRKAIASLEAVEAKPSDYKTLLADLSHGLEILDAVQVSNDLSPADVQSCKKGRRICLRVLDRVSGEVYSSDVIGSVVYKDNITNGSSKASSSEMLEIVSSNRQRMGLLNTLDLSEKEFKKFSQSRGEYMADALRLKEKLDAGEEEDEDDDDDDDEDSNNGDADDKEMSDTDPGTKPGDDETLKPSAVGDAQNDVAGDSEEPTDVVATVVENGEGKSDRRVTSAPEKSEKNDVVVTVVENGDTAGTEKNALHEFCGDVPSAPEPIRRCLAVLRTLCQTSSAEPFLFPVDPQSNPGYYEVTLKPMCFREVGMRLRDAASLCGGMDGEMQKELVESIVAQFARNVRLIAQNSAAYVNAGAMVVCAGEEMIRIFERLLLDWVLAPKNHLPPLEALDDDRCVEHHPSDEDSTVLLCDGCEGKYNMSRLDPPMTQVPKENWYCPRCVSLRSWETLDPRIGKTVQAKSLSGDGGTSGVIRKCVSGHPEGHNTTATLFYEVEFGEDKIAIWTLSEVDKALAADGQPVEPIACLEAVAESPGYGGLGIDRGVFGDLVPVPLNPRVSNTAAEAAISSTVYRDTIAGSSSLRLISPEEMTAHEWLRLLVLLITKCSSSELMQSLVSKMENEEAEKMVNILEKSGKVRDIQEILPSVSDNDEVNVAEGTSEGVPVAADGSPSESSGQVQTVKAESVEEVDATAVVVDASAIEVVADVEMEPVVVAEKISSVVELDEASSQAKAGREKRATAFVEKEKRVRARENSIASFCIKNELRPTVASFEEDVVSSVVDSTLGTEDKGLTLQACRCRGMVCDFCGLSDIALGSPLVRTPSSKEWDDLMPHAARSRRTTLLAELPGNKKLAAVTIRIDGDIVSVKPEADLFDGIDDGGMTEFLPRNEKGFQHELQFRDESGLPFVTGSLSAHECCATSVHSTRKERVLRDHADKQAYIIEWEHGMACGRTLSLGKDANGRSFWRFKGDSSLFVCANESVINGDMFPRKKWYRFAKPEEIASLLYSLGTDGVVPELKRAFPAATQMLKTRKWTELLLKRRFPIKSKSLLADTSTPAESAPGKVVPQQGRQKDDEDEQPYEENENVLVESSNGKLLWNATIVGVSQSKDTGKVTGYRVHYDDWSSRFDEWVDPFRVVERVENNIEVQAEMLEEAASSRDGVPPELDNMVAKKFLRAKGRARGLTTLPNFSEVARVEPTATSGKKTLGMLKAALLILEAALPSGAVDTSNKGAWRPSFAAVWRTAVRNARGPASLMRCLVLLESSLALEWVDPHYSHILSCLPIGWKAINEATVGLIALRIFVIDRGIHYED